MAGRSLSIRCVALLVLVSLSSARCWSWPPFTGIGDASTASNFQEEQKAEDLIRKDRRGSPFDADGHSLATAHTRLKERRLLNPAEPQASPSCWQTAYNQLSASCRQIIRDESLKSHLAIRFSNCFLRASGRRVIACKEHMAVEMCTRGMSDHEHAIYLAFFLDVEAECHHLQSEAFKQEVEDTVNALKVSAQWLEDELSTMVDQSEAILENSAESLTAQRQLAEQQALMDASFKDGLSSLGDVTRDIKFGLDEMDKAQRQFAALQAQQGEVLVQAMANLDSQARQLGSSMEKHAAGQEQMLKSQAEALQLVLHIKHLQRTAMDDQKAAIEQLAKLAKIHQTETATWHKEMARSQTSLLNGHTKVAAELAELSGAAEEHHVATRDWFNEMDNAHSRLAEGAAAILAAQVAILPVKP